MLAHIPRARSGRSGTGTGPGMLPSGMPCCDTRKRRSSKLKHVQCNKRNEFFAFEYLKLSKSRSDAKDHFTFKVTGPRGGWVTKDFLISGHSPDAEPLCPCKE